MRICGKPGARKNTCAKRKNPNKKTNEEKRLEKRIRDYDLNTKDKKGTRCPGSLK